jgi:Fe2+ or Zn2+ uptake regulation protein
VVQEFPSVAADRLITRLRQEQDFQVRSIDLDVAGLCAECQAISYVR